MFADLYFIQHKCSVMSKLQENPKQAYKLLLFSLILFGFLVIYTSISPHTIVLTNSPLRLVINHTGTNRKNNLSPGNLLNTFLGIISKIRNDITCIKNNIKNDISHIRNDLRGNIS